MHLCWRAGSGRGAAAIPEEDGARPAIRKEERGVESSPFKKDSRIKPRTQRVEKT